MRTLHWGHSQTQLGSTACTPLSAPSCMDTPTLANHRRTYWPEWSSSRSLLILHHPAINAPVWGLKDTRYPPPPPILGGGVNLFLRTVQGADNDPQ